MEKAKSLRVAHFIPYLGGAQGGPVFDLSCSAAGQIAVGCDVSIFTTARKGDGARVAVDHRAEIVTDDSPTWGAFRRSPALWNRAESSACDILHSHCLWTDVNRLAADLARRRKIPHVLTPCGMLAKGALRHHWWNKVPARIWFQVRALREAACLQAQSEIEVGQIRDFGLQNPVALIPASVPGRPQDRAVSAQEFRSLFQVPAQSRVLLYLGRLHPVKGLSRLVEAWGRLRPHTGDWLLVLAGPNEGGFEETLRSQAGAAGVSDRIGFTGALDHYQKWGALDAAELFVMPSDFENFGLAIVEAMQSGLPVVTTTGTPWQELPAAGAGWWIEPTVDALASTLQEALQMPEETRREMGRQALKYSQHFRPEKAAVDLIQVYKWLLHQAPRPACVRLD
jgi:glycosyltransferase involved in cell wall biosynthesis